MKAKQHFVIYLDKDGNMTSYYSGEDKQVTKKEFKVNDEVPDVLVADLIKTNPDFLQVEYGAGQFVLTEDERKRFNMVSGKIERPALVEPRYSQENLTKILNEQGMKGLKEIGDKFGVKDRSSKNLIMEILRAQEEHRRTRKV